MNRFIANLCLLTAVAVVSAGTAHGQKATEVYIPIGQSPGVSSSSSWYGTIDSLNYEALSLDIRMTDGSRTIRVTDNTLYYLDRSKYGKSNETGTLEDCVAGRSIEAYVDEDGNALWIKVEVE